MKKIYIFFLLCLCHAVLHAQLGGSGGDYDPANPPNPVTPETKYVLTTTVTPMYGGSTNIGAEQAYTAGTEVYVSASRNTGYVFLRWLEGDSLISTTPSFYYTMPAHKVNLRAEYKYDPESPADPEAMGVSYNLTLVASPAAGGSFNQANRRVEENTETSLYAYTNMGYEFVGWQLDGKIISTDSRFYYTMPSKNTTLTGVFKYNPTNPGNPGANVWTEATGEVIADDFKTGYLYDAIYNLTQGNYDAVSQITVIGRIDYSDFNIANSYGNCTYLDMSRTTGVNYVPSYSFYYNSTLTSIVLPACIESIEWYAFSGCSNLAEITCYAPVPPSVGFYAFNGIQDGCVVYVPAASLALYQDADTWKDFTILPMADDVNALEVNLPAGSEDGRYKNMYIELLNIKNGQKLRYVVSDRLVYTFSSLMHNTQWKVFLKNAQDVVLGEIDDIDIQNEDVSVTFTDVMTPRNLKLSVLTATGEDVTEQTAIAWLDEKDAYLAQGSALPGQLDGAVVKYRVTLPQSLAMEHVLPTEQTFTVSSETHVTLPLQALPVSTLTGVIRDITTEQPVANATVNISQALNGLYSKALNVRTDANGQFSIGIYDTQYAPLQLTVSAPDYISKAVAQDELANTEEGLAAEVLLKSISGATITLGYTYTESTVAGEAGKTQNWYSDYANVSYTVYNVTQNKAINEFSAQYPQIVLMEEVNEGDEIRLTATSRTSAFVPVTATATIDAANRGSATFNVVQLGQIAAAFGTTENAVVVGSLYDGRGKLLKTKNYSNARLSFPELTEGDYTLVTMAKSSLFNSVYDLAQLPATGLTEGVDYVKNQVTVTSGVIATIDNDLVPFLDESKLYYTGNNTAISVNKTQATAGNYLTLSGRVDFKPAYAGSVSDVRLIVDLPEESSLVDNSVMIGASTGAYMLEGHRVTIPMDNIAERVRFCFIPTAGGDYAPSAYVQFTLNDKEVTQPIGGTSYSVKDLSINVPSLAAKTTVPVSGTAVGKSTVELYDNGTLVGQTTALANGAFATTIELESPYNLSTHEIYARITTPAGVVMQSEARKLTYDADAIQVSKVVMYHNNPEMNKTYEVSFDFLNPSAVAQKYIYYIYNKQFTFTIDFTVNDPEKVTDVKLRVLTGDGSYTVLPTTFDKKRNRWVANGEFGNMYDGNIPLNVAVAYSVQTTAALDYQEIEEVVADWTALKTAYDGADEVSAQMEAALADLYAEGDVTHEKVAAIYAQYDTHLPDAAAVVVPEGIDTWTEGQLITYQNEVTDKADLLLKKMNELSIEDLIGQNILAADFEQLVTTAEGNTYMLKVDQYAGNAEKLLADGYTAFQTTVGDVYLKQQNAKTEFVNLQTKLYIAMTAVPGDGEAKRRAPQTSVGEPFASALSTMEDVFVRLDKVTETVISGVDAALDYCDELIEAANEAIAEQQKLRDIYLAIGDAANNYESLPTSTKAFDSKINELTNKIKKLNGLKNQVKGFKSTTLTKKASLFMAAKGLYDDINNWGNLYVKITGLIPCEGNNDLALQLQKDVLYYGGLVCTADVLNIVSAVDALFTAAASVAGAPASGGTSVVIGGGAALALSVVSIGAGIAADYLSNYHYNRLKNEIARLSCNRSDDEDDDNWNESNNPNADPAIDPSGYVYEGVSTNRVQGVTATAYYKEMVEDMYGDVEEKVVLWNAAEYAQENPLFTDEEGMYRWDVPAGLWQVKFEKEGYQTTYSEWLPVPPPQLEVNIPIVQDRQPEVASAHAYEDGVEVVFDKYMQPEYLTAENIIVTKNGVKLEGTILLLDAEETYEGSGTEYASRVKFVPANDEPILPTDEVVLNVSLKVRSYAGLQMQESYTQAFDVEKAVRTIVVDPTVTIAYEGERQLLVSAQPADAAVGKKLLVKTTSKMIADVSAGNDMADENGSLEVVLDDEGQATIKLTGELPGSTVVTFSIAEANVSAQTAATVTSKPILDTPAPVASRASGSAVYRGTAITLSCETDGAVIYYTLDGSCPCDAETRLTYDGTPIIISEDVTLRAMAQGVDMYESDVVDFSYTIKQTVSGITLQEGWNWVSHNVAVAQNAVEVFANADEVKSQTKGLIKDAVFGLTGNLTELLPTEAYMVKANALESVILKGEEFNAGATAIPVQKGWNWIGYPVNQTMALAEAFAKSTPNDGDLIVGKSGYAEFIDDEWIGSLEVLSPGQGYKYLSDDTNSILFNTSIVSNAKSRYGHATVKRYLAPWAVNIYQYPNVMPVTADLFVNDEKAEADAYSIGAFCGTECRGVGKYVKGVLFLSVYGEGNENITFLAADNKTDELYDITESLIFKENNIGSYRAPFALHMGNKATEIDGINAQFDVSPAIARDVITVTLPAAQIDRLVIISMGGTPVISTGKLEVPAQVNVASLPEGTYIVAATSGGRTYYKKVIKVN